MRLTIKDLTKQYSNGVKAMDGVNLEITSGMFGLLGPNGAGKSTLMRTLATLQDANKGEVWLDDINVLREKEKVKRLLGYLPQEFGVYRWVSAQDMLMYFARIKGVTGEKPLKVIVQELLKKVNLYDQRKKSVHTFSGGMKQRLGIAITLLGDPRLIIVDEPTAGLDPAERVRFNNLLSHISREKIVILSTHIVDDVNDLCPQMAIMDEGKVKLQGATATLVKQMEGKIWQKQISKDEMESYSQSFSIVSTRLVEGNPMIHVWSQRQPGSTFTPASPSLADLYFATIKNYTSC